MNNRLLARIGIARDAISRKKDQTSLDYMVYGVLTNCAVELKEQSDVVRCKDCVFWQDNNDGYPHHDCKWREDETPDPDDYCSVGERKEGR